MHEKAIDLLRFPLAIMVIFIHISPPANGMGVLFSHVLSHIAVPTFYLISGFLFFLNFREWSWSGYEKKMKSRFRTLLFPYLLWNLAAFILGVAARSNVHYFVYDTYAIALQINWHIFYDVNVWGTDRINWLGIHLVRTGPFDLPLWFLRDLIVTTAFTPVIYYSVKKLRLAVVALLFLAYISRIWPLISGISIEAFFFFTMGAYFALNGKNVVDFACRFRYLFLPLACFLCVVTTLYDGVGTVIGQNIYPFWIISGVFSVFYLASVGVSRYHLQSNKLLVSSCFFIFAAHTVYAPFVKSPLTISQQLMHLLIPGQSGIEDGVCYLVSPFVTAAICICVYLVLRKFFPKLALLLSGNR